MVTIISRKDWGSVYGAPKPTLPLNIKKVFIHTFAGAYKKTSLEDSITHMRAVERFHVKERGWQGFGYSWAIDTQGRIFEGRGERGSGAHTLGYNSTSYGIGLFGHGDQDAATPAQVQSVTDLLLYMKSKNLVAQNYTIHGHREVSKKSCPGNLIYPLVTNGTWASNNLTPAPEVNPPLAVVLKMVHSSTIHHAYLTYLGRYASDADVAVWIPHFQDEDYGRSLIANSAEAQGIANHDVWLGTIMNAMGISQHLDVNGILGQLSTGKVNRGQVVDVLMATKATQPSYSTNITIDDIAIALAEKLLK